ncbi:flagellar biosynthetic protein FliO [Nitratireductor sp. XY-223]|uniref:flagellar biosynthetic protein FliO n=1 Tax=Nitratireductor sp. XY-223 TaxID=2561926 RepID=UPI0010AB1611|nr:flagellar biosynthetic protein FliO [Nitratireductor sp. XY-223]
MGDALFSTDGMSLYSMLAVGVVILIAIGLLVWNLRRRGHMAFIRGGGSRQPRLAVLDATAVDARRKLVLVRRDNIEHLLMIGGPSDIVVERGINRAAMRAAQQEAAAQQSAVSQQPAAAQQPSAPPAPKPQQRPQPQKAPPPPKSAEPITTEPLSVPPSKPADKPPAPPAKEVAAKPEPTPADKQKPAGEPPRPVTEAKPAPAPVIEPPAPELAAVAVSAAVSDAVEPPSEKKDDPAITAELEDVLEAARDLVLPEKDLVLPEEDAAPTVQPEADAPSKEAESKPSQPPEATVVAATAGIPLVETAAKPADNIEAPAPTVTADELIADFDRVLEAEMSKAEQQKLSAEKEEPEVQPESEKDDTVKPPAASLEDEMKKLLGDLTVKH